jgi:hypothetical protein
MEVSGQLRAPAILPRVKSRRYPLDRKLGGLQSRSGRSGEGKKSHHSTSRELNPSRSHRSLFSILTELTRIL